MAITYVGKRQPRIEGVAKVTGETLYAADLQLPRMLHGRVLRSRYAHARIRRIDATAARDYPGVERVFTASDIPNLPHDTAVRGHALLAYDEVLYYGQPVAVVLASDPGLAEEALDLITVEYEELPPVVDPLEAMRDDAPMVRFRMGEVDRTEEKAHMTATVFGRTIEIKPGSNVTQHLVFARGDVEKALAESDVVVEQQWRAAMVHQGYIEPQVAVADYRPASGEYTVWTSTQGQFFVRSELAKILEVPETKVRVVGMEVGGGFGAKVQPFLTGLCAVAAQLAGRPVKMVMSRSEDLKAANPAPQAVIDLKIGAKRDGTLTGLKARMIYDAGAYPGGPLLAGMTWLGGYYKWPNLEIDGYEVMTNKVSVGALRAPGVPQSTFAIESQMDMLAERLGVDPLELRLKNAVEEGDLVSSGQSLPRIGLKACLERIRDSELWRRRTRKEANRGFGMAIGAWMGGVQGATATVILNADGTVSLILGVNDITGVNTSFAQIVADELGVPLSAVLVKPGDTSNSPFAGVSGGSKTLRSVGAAVRAASIDAKRQILEIASQQMEASPADLEIVEGQIRVKGSPERAVTLGVVGSLTTGFGSPYAIIVGKASLPSLPPAPAFSLQAVELAVDPDTGVVTVLDAVCAQDVGFAVNPLSVEGQIQGGVSQALGIGLLEEMVFDDQGILRNPTLLDYRMPTALDLPNIQALLVEVPVSAEPYGARGVGEPPITAGAAAVANAIADGVGVRVTRLPATPERILEGMGKLERS